MRRMLIILCFTALSLAAACQEHSNGDSPEMKKAAPLVPPDSANFKTPKFGISTPNVEHDFEVAAGQSLILKGWYAADEQLTITYDLNGRKSQALSETRDDVKSNHPEFKYAQGWLVFVPAKTLKSENDLAIHYGDKTWPIAVKVK